MFGRRAAIPMVADGAFPARPFSKAEGLFAQG